MKIKWSIFFLLWGVFSSAQLCAQQTANNKSSIQLPQDTIKAEEEEEKPDTAIIIPDDFDSSLDYILYSWAVDKNAPSDCGERSNPETTETEYKSRLKKLPHIIEMPYNPVIKSFIEIYTVKRRTQVEYMLGLSKYYFPIFEDALEAERLPLELKFLPIIESALTPTAISRAGAAGLWQFMISTGRLYNLEINSLVDERFDPAKSTKVAVIYLKELYSIYGDWNLAIAAYNCGPGSVNKAIKTRRW
ncbi:MAG: lytic transglycosylase domain-containing protein [Paludibacteraceae bacterium]